MQLSTHLLLATGRLNSFEELINSVAENALAEIKPLLKLEDVDIVIYDNPSGTIPELGIGGYTQSKNLVFISLDPSKEHLGEIIRNELRGTLAHELHHTARSASVGYGKTLIEAEVTEGLADHFVLELIPSAIQPWDNALSVDQMKELTELSKKETGNYSHSEWFFGEGKYPRWTGYSIGFRLVNDYLKKNKDKKASMLTGVSAEDIVNLA